MVYERNEYVKVSKDELYGRIIRLTLEDFFDEWGEEGACGIERE
jgi:hypothetical protein